jgi:hypothetical protein
MSPPRLSEATLHSVRSGTILPTYDRGSTRIGIVHIGPGAFHRAHQAYYVDTLLHSDKRWAISALSLKSTGLRDALAAQQGLYTLVELGAAPRARVIGAIRELLVGATDAEAAFARLAARDTRIVSLTVTEKGYCLDATNQLDPSNSDIAHDLANPGATAKHHRLDRGRLASAPRAGSTAVCGAELRQPPGQRCGVEARARRVRAAFRCRPRRAGSKQRSPALARWSTASRRPRTMRCGRARRRSPASLTRGRSSVSRSRNGWSRTFPSCATRTGNRSV